MDIGFFRLSAVYSSLKNKCFPESPDLEFLSHAEIHGCLSDLLYVVSLLLSYHIILRRVCFDIAEKLWLPK